MTKTTHSTVDNGGTENCTSALFHCIQEAMKLKYKITP